MIGIDAMHMVIVIILATLPVIIFSQNTTGKPDFLVRERLSNWLLPTPYDATQAEFPGYDGWYNNLARPDSGAVDKPLLRRWPAAYEDGTYKPAGSNRPNPLTVSERILSGPIGSRSKTGKNALLVYFGQQVVEEILDAQRAACPPEYFNIPIPANHTYRAQYSHSELPVLRTRFDQRTGLNPNNPRQQINEITPYIDGNLMYGITKLWADQLRTYPNNTIDEKGRLASSHGGLFPAENTQRMPLANPPTPFNHSQFIKEHQTFKVERFFKLGNPRGNENTFLLTFGILWFRWHNYLAAKINNSNPTWTSDQIFNEARKWMIATHQHIVIDEWLPAWLNEELAPYAGYDPSVDPQIDQFFQSAAFRFGHTLVTPGVYIRDYGDRGCQTATIRTCNAFWRPQDAILAPWSDVDTYTDIDRILLGMAYQICEEEDHKIVEDLRGNVFGPLEFPRRDLMAINIQRGRDHGLPDFNTARRAFNLLPYANFDNFTLVTPQIREELKSLYNNDINNIDVWVGGILETDNGPGELFKTIIIDQFDRIRKADRFWYENRANGLFTEDEIRRIKELKMYDIILAVTKVAREDIQRDVFNVPLQNNSRCPQMVESTCVRNGTEEPCYYLPLLNQEILNEACFVGESYDYFSNSEASYIFTFILLSTFIVGVVTMVYSIIFFKDRKKYNKRTTEQQLTRGDGSFILGKELLGPKRSRLVLMRFNESSKNIEISSIEGLLLRTLDCTNNPLYIKTIDMPCLFIKCSHEYDLVIKFQSNLIRDTVEQNLKQFAKTIGAHCTEYEVGVHFKNAMNGMVTQETRKQQLETFFKYVVAQAFKTPQNVKMSIDATTSDVIAMELTKAEFADVLNTKADSLFVGLMFKLVDKDQNGFISFREFVDFMVIFADGTHQDKAKLLFDMYDIDRNGLLSVESFRNLTKAFFENVQGQVANQNLDETINSLLKRAGLAHKSKLTFDDFLIIVGDDFDKLERINIPFKYADNMRIANSRKTIQDIYGTPQDIQERFKTENFNETASKPSEKPRFGLLHIIENYSKQIFWLTLYTLVLLAIFAERAYYYSVEREHSGLRRIAGYGVTVTRGAASAMMFTYSSLLVTMCRNLITKCRETCLNKYFPFDFSLEIHKYIAYWGLFFTLMHIIGHAFNFYHIATQTSDDLTCLFRNYFHATHEIPKFHYWCWLTITGFTGILLVLITAIIYVFATPLVRRKLFNYFWSTHNLYPIFYILMILHGCGRLIQEPYFYYFFLGPVILFSIDQTISISRKKIEISVKNVKLLPSDVTLLEIEKPRNFEYKSGQWVRIACVDLNMHEYHPFTLSSSPDEQNLTVHIRAVGPWTRHLRKLYGNALQMDKKSKLPKIYLDGPFGEGHQDWYQYDVSILVGGGIGVTPFASILKDIVFRSNLRQLVGKKVYFVWVSKDQKQFEWLTDLLRDIEAKDESKIINTHIYITQFYDKFDLRTIMLYIFERHYQKLSNRSLFTNLEAVTHFGRPNFTKFFKTIQNIHPTVGKIGVFSCGNPAMISSINSSCIQINKQSTTSILEHHYKTF